MDWQVGTLVVARAELGSRSQEDRELGRKRQIFKYRIETSIGYRSNLRFQRATSRSSSTCKQQTASLESFHQKTNRSQDSKLPLIEIRTRPSDEQFPSKFQTSQHQLTHLIQSSCLSLPLPSLLFFFLISLCRLWIPSCQDSFLPMGTKGHP